MIDDVSDIAAYYNNDPEREHSRLERHRLEHDLTWRFLNQYLPSQGTILEIGAATGRYTLELAKRGYLITAVQQMTRAATAFKDGSANFGLIYLMR